MKLPGCTHCNELVSLPAGNLTGISGYKEALMIVGEDYFIKRIITD
jgi:hypothetical protein